jgi:hypothetical protein
MTNQAASQDASQELLDLERQFWQAIKDRDMDKIMRLTDEQCVVAGAQGVSAIDRQTMAKMLDAPSYSLNDFAITGEQVRLLADNVAVVAYRVREQLTVEGKPVTFEASDASTWIRRDGHWRCALHTESIAGDPFGRDRQA